MIVQSEPYGVGRGYSVEFRFDAAGLHCEWSPGLPKPAIGRKLLPAYYRARDSFLRDLSAHIGGIIAVVDA